MRTVRYTLPTDTSFFTPLQLQPRMLLSQGMSAWARWARANLVSFPRLVKEHGASLVMLGIRLEYLAPFRFFDADEVEVVIDVHARAGGELLTADLRFNAAGREIVRGDFVMKPVLLTEMTSLTATPGPLPAALMARFEPDEIVPGKPERLVGPLVESIESGGQPIATWEHPFTVHRSHCEVADQWSFTDVADLAAASRESLALTKAGTDAAFRVALAEPIRDIHIEIAKPYFAFDTGTVRTQVYVMEGRPVFLHRFVSSIGTAKPHGTVVERF